MRLIGGGLLLLLALAALLPPTPVDAHGVLVDGNPTEGAGLLEPPTAIILTFSEAPEPTLSEIVITAESGAAIAVSDPVGVTGDPRSITTLVPPLDRGVYTVAWRIVSRVDGHATGGAYAFGVGITPDQAQIAAAAAASGTDRPAIVELVGRWLLLGGLVAAIGAAIGLAVGFVSDDRHVLLIGTGVALVGLGALALAQRSSAGIPFGEFWDTHPGRAIGWRFGLLVLVAAIAAAVPRGRSGRWEAVAAVAALGGVAAVHVSAGHAAAGASGRTTAAVAQWAHIMAAGAWIGGLLTLVLCLRALPDRQRAARGRGMVRRFTTVAAVGLGVVAVAGTLRAFGTLSGPTDLIDTAYGAAVLVKIIVITGLAGLGLTQRLRAVPVADAAASAGSTTLLQRLARPELGLAAVAILASGALASLSPPIESADTGLRATGRDSTGQVAARLTTQSRLPGPNRFEIELTQAPDGVPSDADAASLRFRPVDDPTVPATTLALEPGEDGRTLVARGANLSFAGRWELTLTVQRGAEAWTVPLELTTDTPPLFRTLTDLPDLAPEYLVRLPDNGIVSVSPFPERDELLVRFFNWAGDVRNVERVVVTVTVDGNTAQRPLTRRDESSFTVPYEFPDDRFAVAVIARDADDDRLYATFEIDPARPDR